jgi:sec-independent protein translocase protein TatC
MYEIIMFVTPGLTAKERRYLFISLPAALLAFASGVVFAYFVLVPPALRFLLGFGSEIAQPMIRIGNYVNVMVMLLFWIGVSFETPLVMLLIAKIGLVSYRGFARWRRYWILVAFLLGAVITPTFDPVNQCLVALPLIVLYELGILLARLFGARRPRAAQS